MNPEVFVTRPLKLRLKRKSKSSFQSEYVEDIKRLEQQNTFLPAKGESIFWVDRRAFILGPSIVVEISQANEMLDADTLDLETMAVSSEVLSGKSSWEMNLTIPYRVDAWSGKLSLVHWLQEVCGIGSSNYEHTFAYFEPQQRRLVRGKGYITSTMQHSNQLGLTVDIQGTSDLITELI
jgi:hypothetical protein